MAQNASAAFDTLVESVAQEVAWSVVVTLPVGIDAGYGDLSAAINSIDLDKAIQTDTNEQTTLIGGYPAMELTVEAAGYVVSSTGSYVLLDQLFNTADPDSPLYGKQILNLPVVFDQGLYVDDSGVPELIRQFTGIVDTVDINNGVVTLTCIDNSSQIRGAAYLEPVITQAPENAGLTGTYAIDALLRNSSPARFYSWPAQHPNCVLAVGFESSIWPEVGSLYAGFVQAPTFVPGPYGTGLGAVTTLVVYTPSAPLLTTDKICMHLLSGGDFSVNVNDDPATYQIIFQRVGTTLYLYSVSPTGQTVASWSITAGNHELEYSVSWPASSTSVTGTVWIDGVSHAVSFAAKDTRPVARSFVLVAVGGNAGGLRGLQVTNEASYATLYPFVPTLILDTSLNSLTALPDVSGKTIAAVVQEIAKAENAVAGLDEHGVFRFTNRRTLAAAASTRSVTSATSLLSLSTSQQRSMIATHVQAPVNQIQIADYQIVWQATTALQVDPGVPLVIFAKMDNPAVNVPTQDSGFLDDGAFWSYHNAYYMASNMPDGSGSGIATGVSFTVEQLSATQLKITVTNTNTGTIWLVAPAGFATPQGTPVLIIGGRPILSVNNSVNNDSAAVDGSAGGVIADSQSPDGDATLNTQYGDVLLSIAENDWRQDLASAQTYTDDTLSDTRRPKILYRNLTIIDDPRVQLGDCQTLVDPDVTNINADVIILHAHKTLSDGQWSASIDARGKYRPGKWILGRVGYSELSQTTTI